MAQVTDDDATRILKRKRVIDELVETEKIYLESLRLLVEQFLVAFEELKLQGECGLEDDDLKVVFSNIREIYDLQTTFYHYLQLHCESPKFIGQTFAYLKTRFKIYSEYCVNHKASIALLKTFEDEDQALKNFIQQICQQNNVNLGLEAELLKPMQRILKYPLLLREILKLTKEDEEEFDLLTQGHHGMQEVASYINEVQRTVENFEKILTIQDSFDGLEDVDLLDYGLLSNHGVFKVVSNKNSHQRHIFLFEKALLFSKEEDDRFVLKDSILIDKVTVEDGKESANDIMIIRTDKKSVRFLISYKEFKEKEVWMKLFQDHTQNSLRQFVMERFYGAKVEDDGYANIDIPAMRTRYSQLKDRQMKKVSRKETLRSASSLIKKDSAMGTLFRKSRASLFASEKNEKSPKLQTRDITRSGSMTPAGNEAECEFIPDTPTRKQSSRAEEAEIKKSRSAKDISTAKQIIGGPILPKQKSIDFKQRVSVSSTSSFYIESSIGKSPPVPPAAATGGQPPAQTSQPTGQQPIKPAQPVKPTIPVMITTQPTSGSISSNTDTTVASQSPVVVGRSNSYRPATAAKPTPPNHLPKEIGHHHHQNHHHHHHNHNHNYNHNQNHDEKNNLDNNDNNNNNEYDNEDGRSSDKNSTGSDSRPQSEYIDFDEMPASNKATLGRQNSGASAAAAAKNLIHKRRRATSVDLKEIDPSPISKEKKTHQKSASASANMLLTTGSPQNKSHATNEISTSPLSIPPKPKPKPRLNSFNLDDNISENRQEDYNTKSETSLNLDSATATTAMSSTTTTSTSTSPTISTKPVPSFGRQDSRPTEVQSLTSSPSFKGKIGPRSTSFKATSQQQQQTTTTRQSQKNSPAIAEKPVLKPSKSFDNTLTRITPNRPSISNRHSKALSTGNNNILNANNTTTACSANADTINPKLRPSIPLKPIVSPKPSFPISPGGTNSNNISSGNNAPSDSAFFATTPGGKSGGKPPPVAVKPVMFAKPKACSVQPPVTSNQKPVTAVVHKNRNVCATPPLPPKPKK